jgi:hypothetical protein
VEEYEPLTSRSGTERLVRHATARHYCAGFILLSRSVHTSSIEEIFDTCRRGCVCRGRRLEREIAIFPSIQTKFCILVSLTMPAVAQIITCTMLASMRCGPKCTPPTRNPQERRPAPACWTPPVQVVLVELGGPLRPCQMPRIRQVD